MTRDSKATATRRAVLVGLAGALATAGVVGAQETTTEDGETATPGEGTTTELGETTEPGETTAARGETTTFSVRVVNVSEPDALTPEDGEPGPIVVSPGAYAVHAEEGPLFTPGEPDRGEGLEALAEDGDPSQLAESLGGREGVSASGVFDTPLTGEEPRPAGPGEGYGFQVEAAPGDVLSFATMFVPSNDLFFAPEPSGIDLFRDGDPVAGDVTEEVALWDAGTEENEEPGAGENQAPRQSSPDTGPDEGAPVRRIEDVDDGYSYPDVTDSIQVLVVAEGGNADRTTEEDATTETESEETTVEDTAVEETTE